MCSQSRHPGEPTLPGGPQPGHNLHLESKWKSVLVGGPWLVTGPSSSPKTTLTYNCLSQGSFICHLWLRAHICAALLATHLPGTSAQ